MINIPTLTVDDILNSDSLESLKVIVKDIKIKRKLFEDCQWICRRG